MGIRSTDATNGQRLRAVVLAGALAVSGTAVAAAADTARPNILVIFGDDIGWSNLSLYNPGVMGYTTPNIDRIGHEGVMFTDHYGQPSCTPGRAAFITGQYPIRSGLTTVGTPGSKLGIQAATPTLAEVLKAQGYATGQFGKNHLGDRNEHLPTVHGFDEFFGNLYHLNTEENPEELDYPQDPRFRQQFGPRGVLKCVATDTDDPTEDPRFGRMGKQRCTDTGPLTRKRMETVDEEFIQATLDFIRRSRERGQPFFAWLNTTRMHLYTHLRPEHRYLAKDFTSEEDLYGSGMMEHDMQIGEVLSALKKLGVLEDTIIVYTTDNGPEHSARGHGGTTPFRGEKMTTYEGGVRLPLLVRWPGHIPAGRVLNGIQAHMDLFTTLAAAAGVPDVAEKIRRERKQYIDGVNNLDYWTGKSAESARTDFIYYYESELTGLRWNQWKVNFATKENYYAPIVRPSFPVMFNLRSDPYESYDLTSDRSLILQKKSWIEGEINLILARHLQSLAKYPPVQNATTFDFSKRAEAMKSDAERAH
jgi:arylsulfatase A-like enzyme